MSRAKVQRIIREQRIGAACALVVACCLIPNASARQNSSTGSAPQKSTASEKTSSRKPHTSSSSSAGSKSAKTARAASSKKRSSKRKSARVRGQQKIDSQRAQQIQEALIREHYLSGEATGTWNQESEEAMRRYQADHGWQSKTVPDSRALIGLGLGPSKDHLLNPESAMTTSPERPKSDSLPATSHTAPAAANPLPPVSTTTPASSDGSGPQ